MNLDTVPLPTARPATLDDLDDRSTGFFHEPVERLSQVEKFGNLGGADARTVANFEFPEKRNGTIDHGPTFPE